MNKEYKVRIERVTQYIEANISNNISLTEVAKVSFFSPYHFHRIMRAHLNESLMAYVIRLRLDHSAMLILNTGFSVSDIAYKSHRSCSFRSV